MSSSKKLKREDAKFLARMEQRLRVKRKDVSSLWRVGDGKTAARAVSSRVRSAAVSYCEDE